MKGRALFARFTVGLLAVLGLFASSAEASVSASLDVSSIRTDPFASLPQLTSKPVAETLATAHQADNACIALCELVASIDADPFGYGVKPRPFGGRATPFGRQYQYANDNPTMFVDPSGHETEFTALNKMDKAIKDEERERVWCGANPAACSAKVAAEEKTNRRVLGAVRAVGGVAQVMIGAPAALAPEPVVTKIAAWVAITRGVENFVAGVRQVFTGEVQETATGMLVNDALKKHGGASENEAAAGQFLYELGTDALSTGLSARSGRGLASEKPSVPATGEGGAPSSGGSSKPQWLKDQFGEGDAFNRERAFDYPHREVYVEQKGGGYNRVDAYDPIKGEIVSRKLTQFSEVTEGTGVRYVQELASKYKPGTKIANVPSSGPLAGSRLRGQMILEVPGQQGVIPQAVLDAAKRAGVVIRDVHGHVY